MQNDGVFLCIRDVVPLWLSLSRASSSSYFSPFVCCCFFSHNAPILAIFSCYVVATRFSIKTIFILCKTLIPPQLIHLRNSVLLSCNCETVKIRRNNVRPPPPGPLHLSNCANEIHTSFSFSNVPPLIFSVEATIIYSNLVGAPVRFTAQKHGPRGCAGVRRG